MLSVSVARSQFNVVDDLRRSPSASSRRSDASAVRHGPSAVRTGSAGRSCVSGGDHRLRTTAQRLDELAPEVVVQPAVQ